MSNILEVIFEEGQTFATATRLWKGDYGQILLIHGPALPAYYEVYFASTKDNAPQIQVGTPEGVLIPNKFLQTNGYIYAWTFLHTGENDGETKYQIKIPVEDKGIPIDQETPEEKTAVQQAVEALNKQTGVATEAAASAEGSAKRAEEAAASVDKGMIVEVVSDYLDNNPVIVDETDPTVPEWAKQPAKPIYTAAEVGALPDTYTPPVDKSLSEISTNPVQNKVISTKLSEVESIAKGRATGHVFETESEMRAWISSNAGSLNIGDNLYIRATDVPDYWWDGTAAQPLETQKVDLTEYAKKSEVPAVDTTLTKSSQAADAKTVGDRIHSLSEEIVTTSESKVAAHNTGTDTHSDIRLLIQGLTGRLNALADSDDTTLDQLSEVVAYIKSNRSLIESITTSKVNVSDIVDNLTTNVSNKPMSAAQGVVIKTLIDALRNDKLDAAELTNAVNTALAQAKASGEFDGADGRPGENGTDGYSPTANVMQNDNGATITITDKNGTTTATVKNGKDGADGIPGKDGQPGKDGVGIQSVVQTTTSTADGGTNVITVTKTDGTSSTFSVKNGSKGSPGQAGANGADGKSAYAYAVEGGYTGTEAEFTEKLSQIGGEAEKNLFSFENADNNIAWLSKNKPDTNYIYDQSSTHGYKDTDKNYFVFLCPADRNYGITGGLDNPLPVGSYKLSAEVFIPSGNTSRTTVIFGAWIAPSVYNDSSNFDIGAQDTWVSVEKVFTVAEGDTANYIYCKSFIEKYPIYVRNIKVISLAPDLEGWEGKKWAAVGDSITEKNSKALKQYHDYIAESTGITVVNMGVSGTGYKQYEDTNNAFYQRILNVPTDVDVVTIFGSGNDLSHALGDVTDTGTDTLCGCINTTIDNLYSVLPTVQVGIITPTPWGGYNPVNDNNVMAQYSAKIVEICRLRGIPCLDLYHCSGMRPWDDAFCSSAYNMNSAGDDYDRVHPNSTGHAIFAPRIKAFLQSLIL